MCPKGSTSPPSFQVLGFYQLLTNYCYLFHDGNENW